MGKHLGRLAFATGASTRLVRRFVPISSLWVLAILLFSAGAGGCGQQREAPPSSQAGSGGFSQPGAGEPSSQVAGGGCSQRREGERSAADETEQVRAALSEVGLGNATTNVQVYGMWCIDETSTGTRYTLSAARDRTIGIFVPVEALGDRDAAGRVLGQILQAVDRFPAGRAVDQVGVTLTAGTDRWVLKRFTIEQGRRLRQQGLVGSALMDALDPQPMPAR